MRCVNLDLGPRSYPIHVGDGAQRVLVPLLEARPRGARLAVIADAHVAELHLDSLLAALGPSPLVLTVPPGEASKSLASAENLYDALAAARIERDDVIVSFGGGMVGDLAGFVAATWLRGIDFIQVPTTLLAAVDAAVGGKTGVNHRAGKNLIGAFYQPAAVIVDIDFLTTLPQRDFVAGLAESVKHALVREAHFLDWQEAHADAVLARGPVMLEELIARNCEIKAEVVGRDEREQHLRAVLNYGHTIGHAIEHVLEYELRHGECVALGMLAENHISCARGLLERAAAGRVAGLLMRLGLPARLPRAIDARDILRASQMDKKVRGGAPNFVLLTKPGETTRVADVSEVEIVAALDALQPT
jgi:3-dehydroquinate synthase